MVSSVICLKDTVTFYYDWTGLSAAHDIQFVLGHSDHATCVASFCMVGRRHSYSQRGTILPSVDYKFELSRLLLELNLSKYSFSQIIYDSLILEIYTIKTCDRDCMPKYRPGFLVYTTWNITLCAYILTW